MLRPLLSTIKPISKKSLSKLLEFLRTDTQTTKLDYSSMWLYFIRFFVHICSFYMLSDLSLTDFSVEDLMLGLEECLKMNGHLLEINLANNSISTSSMTSLITNVKKYNRSIVDMMYQEPGFFGSK